MNAWFAHDWDCARAMSEKHEQASVLSMHISKTDNVKQQQPAHFAMFLCILQTNILAKLWQSPDTGQKVQCRTDSAKLMHIIKQQVKEMTGGHW